MDKKINKKLEYIFLLVVNNYVYFVLFMWKKLIFVISKTMDYLAYSYNILFNDNTYHSKRGTIN